MGITDVYRIFFWGGGGIFLHTVLFLFSDVEHSCLPGALHESTYYSFLSERSYAQAGKLGGCGGGGGGGGGEEKTQGEKSHSHYTIQLTTAPLPVVPDVF